MDVALVVLGKERVELARGIALADDDRGNADCSVSGSARATRQLDHSTFLCDIPRVRRVY